MTIPFKKINYDENEIKAVTDVLKSGMVGLGEKVFEFEKTLAKFVGAKYVVAVDSCTSALFLSLKYSTAPLIGIPSMTVPLAAHSVIEAGKRLIFTDNVDWVGNSYQLEGTTIVDSAHQLERNQCRHLPPNFVTCFSFYPTKNIGSADGGAIATNDKDFADWARQASCYGRNQTQKYANSWDYDVEMIGYKRHYTNLQAAICLAQLKKLPAMNQRRKRIRDKYNKAFGYDNTSLYLYRLYVENRDEFIKQMAEVGMTCGVHFKPLHLFKAYRGWPVLGDKELVEKAYRHTVSLPFFDTMTDENVEDVIKAVGVIGGVIG